MPPAGKKKKDVYVPSRTGDFILTAAYIAEVIAIVICFYKRDPTDLLIFAGMIAATACAVKLTDFFCSTVMCNVVSGYILKDPPYKHPLGNRRTMTKFIGTAWQFVIHFSMSLFELYVLYGEPWLSKTYTCFDPINTEFVMKTSLRVFFITQMAIWIYTCYSHRFNSDAHAHKDYFVMYIHHIATIGLVGLAYADGYQRVGLIVLFAHDVSDIGVDLLKLSNYLKLEGPRNFFIVELSYATCITLWGYFRLYLFPVEIIYKSSFFSIMSDPNWLSEDGTKSMLVQLGEKYGVGSNEYNRHLFSAGVCNVLLGVLVILHIWWGALLLRILWRMVTSDNPHAAGQEEYEGASESDTEKVHDD